MMFLITKSRQRRDIRAARAPLFRFSDEADDMSRLTIPSSAALFTCCTRFKAAFFRVGEALEYGIVGINTGIISSGNSQRLSVLRHLGLGVKVPNTASKII